MAECNQSRVGEVREMKPRCLPSWCLAVLLATSTTSSSQDSGGIPRISYGDLTTGAYAAAKTSQGTIEGFYVTDLPPGYQTSLEQLISGVLKRRLSPCFFRIFIYETLKYVKQVSNLNLFSALIQMNLSNP